MKTPGVVFFILVVGMGTAIAQQSAGPQKPKVRPEVSTRVQDKGVAKVGVVLSGDWHLDSKLDKEAALVQRQAIAAAQKTLMADLAGTKHRVISRSQIGPYMSLEVGPDALAVLESSSLVKDVYLQERLYKPTLLQSVPLVGGDQAAAAGFDGTGHAIVVVDTGVNGNHPFLSTTIPGKGKKPPTVVSKVIAEACFSSLSNCPNGQTSQTGIGAGVPCTFAPEGCKHGTHVAGIAGGLGSNFSGVAKGAKLVAMQIFSLYTGTDCSDTNEDPCPKTSDQDIALALEYAYALAGTLPYDISSVNLSLGSVAFSDQVACDAADSRIKTAIDELRNVGIATVVSSGNNSCNGTGCTNKIDFPACISSAISVGSTTKSDAISSFTDSGPFLSLLAPGGTICSSVPTGAGTSCSSSTDFDVMSGTSMAAPHVAGAWAILKQKKPDGTVGQILNALQTTGVKITDTRQGANNRVHCRIQINEALNNIPDQVSTLQGTVANGINNCGQIVGAEYVNWTGLTTDTKGSYTSVIYNGPPEEGGGIWYTEVTGINNKGELAAWYCCGYHGDRGFTRGVNGIDSLDNWDCDTNHTYGNNDLGETVGLVGSFSPGAACSGVGFVKDTTGTYQSFANDIPKDINNLSRMAGFYWDGSFNYHGFYYDGAGRQAFDYPGATNTEVNGINESGQIVGCYWSQSRYTDGKGFVRNSDGTLRTITVQGASGNCATGINDSGQVVGYAWDNSDDYGFVELSW